jgi:hypothetical protein
VIQIKIRIKFFNKIKKKNYFYKEELRFEMNRALAPPRLVYAFMVRSFVSVTICPHNLTCIKAEVFFARLLINNDKTTSTKLLTDFGYITLQTLLEKVHIHSHNRSFSRIR